MPHSRAPSQVTLFVTCIVDQVYPSIGFAAAKLLEGQGISVRVPQGLTCCGQMAMNAGYRDEARGVAGRTIEVLRDKGVIVLPSGSCCTMICHLYAELFRDSRHAGLAAELASRTYELSEFLVDVLGVSNVGARYEGRLTYHDSCHGLRFLALQRQARVLLQQVAGAELVPLPNCEECCGFGGLFAIKQPTLSQAILERKLENIESTNADLLVTGDASCMMQIAGGLSRNNASIRARHLAEVLANMVEARTP